MYLQRIIDKYLKQWCVQPEHKPILLRGARQVGKSTTVRHLGKSFNSFVEINFERTPEYKAVFNGNNDIDRIISQLSALSGTSIKDGETLLFIDEIQECPEAIISLRFFKEDRPGLHVIAAGSLLEFALDELPTFGVGRIHSMFVYPLSFDEFAMACGEELLLAARDNAGIESPLPTPLHDKLAALYKTYLIVGGMPASVMKWIEHHDYELCSQELDDILVGYEADFPKYRKRVNVELLRQTFRSAASQVGQKFVYSEVGVGYKTNEIKNALNLLIMAGLLIPVTRTDANGLPLGAEADVSFRKMLLFDSGLLLRLMNMTMGNSQVMTVHILTASDTDLVNKGPLAEMVAGLEMVKYNSPNLKQELYYWIRQAKNSLAEVDYIAPIDMKVVPIEVKAGTQGGMKSLWTFMGQKHLTDAFRCSLENFGRFEYTDQQAHAIRHVKICPLYAISRLRQL